MFFIGLLLYVCVGFVCVQIKLFHSHRHRHSQSPLGVDCLDSRIQILESRYWLHTGYIQDTYRTHTGYIQDTYRIHTGYIQDTYRIHTGYIQDTYRIHTGYIQDTYRIHTGYICDRIHPGTDNTFVYSPLIYTMVVYHVSVA